MAFSLFAPAKINLSLRVTGKRADGYHELDSLMVFAADVGDRLTIVPDTDFGFSLSGPYADSFDFSDRSENNLVIRAARLLSEETGNPLNMRFALEKNLPIASGLGGGSSDAAACLKGLGRLWNVPNELLERVGRTLGAELTVCLYGRAARVRGIGEKIEPAEEVPKNLNAVLVNPNRPCSTAEVFRRYKGAKRSNDTENDLLGAACEVVSEISNVLEILREQKACLRADMSGAGATCFGLFPDKEASVSTTKRLAEMRPDWWVVPALLNANEAQNVSRETFSPSVARRGPIL